MLDAIPRQRGRVAALTALVCLISSIPYWRAIMLPTISDTYLQVWLGRKFGGMDGLPALASDALYRCRATSIWITSWLDSWFGMNQAFLNFQSLFLHVLNVGLIATLGRFPHIGYRLSIPAALFWGFNERHHEAVMWYAALPEQLVFTFIILTFHSWMRWWNSGSAMAYAASLASFVLALLSKESGVVACALLAFPLAFETRRWRDALKAGIPFVALSIFYFFANMAARDNHLHWNDGTFTLGWHFIPVEFNSTLRLITVWGAAALALIWFHRRALEMKLVYAALLWIPIALGPYAFVAYQPRVPSRHTYLASLGVALLLAVAMQPLMHRRRLFATLLLAYLSFNTGYLWFFKHHQFVERANVTEYMVRDAAEIWKARPNQPIQVSCFPLSPEIATIALSQRLSIPESLVKVQYSKNPSCGPITVQPLPDERAMMDASQGAPRPAQPPTGAETLKP